MEFYVYALIDPRDDAPFYVGKGKGNRCYQHLKKIDTHNPRKQGRINSIRESGGEVIVKKFAEYLTEQGALDEEKRLISKFGRRHIDEGGVLLNLAKGGNGGDTSAFFTDESRRKIRKSSRGVNNRMAKLTEAQVLEIYHAEDTSESLVKKYKISKNQIHAIKRKRQYRDIVANIAALPGKVGGKHKTRTIYPDDIVEKIFSKEGNYDYFREQFGATRNVVLNIKRRKSFKSITVNLGNPGQVVRYKFTNDDLTDIRESVGSTGQLAEKYNVCDKTIQRIRNGIARYLFVDEF